MRLMVLSDSHGDSFSLRLALSQQPTASVVFFLGDGEHDLDGIEPHLSGSRLIAVRGNCDFGSTLPAYAIESFAGKTVYATHGYAERVKYGEEELLRRAKDCGAAVALFGHTHTPCVSYIDGVYLFNPGSIRDGVYGVVDISERGIVCFNVKLRYSL